MNGSNESWFNQLSEPWLRRAFLAMSGVQWRPLHEGDAIFMDREEAKAAVLVPLVLRAEGLHVLLTQRTQHLSAHAGQVSFPGGKVEDTDTSPAATALRETHEETGVPPELVEVIGTLPQYRTASNFLVTPVVGFVQPTFTIEADAFEVAEVFEVPLAFLMNPSNHKRHEVDTPKGKRDFYSMPYPRADGGEPYFIWGATAAMLRNLYQYLDAFYQS